MWQTRFSMINDNPKDIEYVEKKLQNIQNLTFAKTYTKNNVIFSIACAENFILEVKKNIDSIACEVILIFYKLRFILYNLNLSKDMDSDMCVFVSALLYFDLENEKDELMDILAGMYEYSLDGVYFFAIKNLKEDWNEECLMAEDLLDSEYQDRDLYNIALFLQSAREKKLSLFLADTNNLLITNVTNGGIIEIKQLYKSPINNLISAIIENSASEIIMENQTAKSEIVNLLRKFVKIKLI